MQTMMAQARGQMLRALLARCSTKWPRAAAATTEFSCLRRAVPSSAHFASSYSGRLLPASGAAATAAAQTRSLASEARGGESGSEEEGDDWWEEEDDAEPEIGDGGDGGGVFLRDVKWGQRALAVAEEVLAELFGDDDITMFAFKVSPKGYVYVRLDKISSRYGCPGIEAIESFNKLYRQKLDELIESGEIPLDLAIEVSSPGAERLLKVPEDLDRFKDMALRVQYLAEGDDLVSEKILEKDGIFLLESMDTQAEHCVWKLADVKENRDEAGKGRPLNRKQRDWRVQTSFKAVKKATLYLD